MFLSVKWVMAALFAVSALAQYNDVDPMRWMLMYGAASTVTAMAAARGHPPLSSVIIVGMIALGWGAVIAMRAPSASIYASMFDSWTMHSSPVESAREASGLFIVAAWMCVLFLGHRRVR